MNVDSKNEFKINELLSIFLKRTHLEQSVKEVEAADAWKRISGKLIANLTVSVYVKNTVMYVKLRSPSLRQELNYKQSTILERLNEELGGNYISKIVFA